eukprot:CAMPEP_0171985668 /NCGR_PEP_ID=MMETSP0993-20121228/274471_1 /TAXON_ID=483369 /ORGANISM="non described non described, Strain CCMP2098" /LENGTH=126 /DNA_ID=CAMNT_0012638547 /DNA_START=514 /DNA_END=894 /DNA_ORIENTATION=-
MTQQLEGPDGGFTSNGGAFHLRCMLTYVEIKGAVSSMYFNNVSGVHHKIQRSRFAVHYFQKAATECSNGNDESGSDVETQAKSGGGGGESGPSGAVHYFQKATECSNGNDESGSDSGNTGQEQQGW